MVALAFKPNPEGKPYVCHLDDDKTNSHVDNLMWGTATDNMRHMVEHGRAMFGELGALAKVSEGEVRVIREVYANERVSQMELARAFGIDQTSVSDIVLKKTWRHL